MSLIVILTNDGTGTGESANYLWSVRVNDRELFTGRLTGHNRKNGVWGLLGQLAIEQLGIAGTESHSPKGEAPLGPVGEKVIACPLVTYPPDSAPGAIPGETGAMRIDLIEQAVLTSPRGMEGWRMFRIEYGGHAENCLCEGTIWLPPDADRESIGRFLQRTVDGQAP